ncbi:MAG: hypothetical protein WCE54_04685 [Ignavibacteriaceae bacterium]
MIETIIKNESSIDLITDITNFSIDQVLESPIKELPIIKYLIGIVKLGISVRDRFLIKKILIFLKELDKIEKQEKEKFKEKIKSDKNYSNKIGEQLIFILDRYDHLTKAEMLAKLFVAHIDERVTYEEFLRLSIAIDRAFINDLLNLSLYYQSNLEEVNTSILQNLYQCGLVSLLFNTFNTASVQYQIESSTYVRNDLGMLLCKIVFNYPQDANLIVPNLSDFENKIFTRICENEITNQEFIEFDTFITELKKSLKLETEELNFILTKFKKLNLIKKTEQNAIGDYLWFYTSFIGFNFYFQKLTNRNDFLIQIVKSLINNELGESVSYSQEKKVSKRIVEHCLILLSNKGLINTQDHSAGILVNQINETELKKFIKNIE